LFIFANKKIKPFSSPSFLTAQVAGPPVPPLSTLTISTLTISTLTISTRSSGACRLLGH
jgi:hypothetical protein